MRWPWRQSFKAIVAFSETIWMSAMDRRDLLKTAAGAAISIASAGKARGQSKLGMPKEMAMANVDVSATTIQVEHVTIPSRKSFESVKAELESPVPHVDDQIFALLYNGEAERARQFNP